MFGALDPSPITVATTAAAGDLVDLLYLLVPIALTIAVVTWGVPKAWRFFKRLGN